MSNSPCFSLQAIWGLPATDAVIVFRAIICFSPGNNTHYLDFHEWRILSWEKCVIFLCGPSFFCFIYLILSDRSFPLICLSSPPTDIHQTHSQISPLLPYTLLPCCLTSIFTYDRFCRPSLQSLYGKHATFPLCSVC